MTPGTIDGRRSNRTRSRGDLIARLLKGSWRSCPPSHISINERELEEITPLLCSSGAGGLAWWRIKQTEMASTDCGRLLQQAYRLQALNVTIHERQIRKVFSKLRKEGVEPLLVKGWAAASIYADAALRPYGDIDLLVRSDDFKTARSLLAGEEVRDCWVDLHTRFGELEDRSTDALFRRSRLLELDGELVRVLSPEDHLALICIHLLKHGAWRPLWLCDIAATIESLPEEFDWETCLGDDKKRHGWISIAISLSRRLIEAKTDRVFDKFDQKLPNWVVRSVLHQWSHLYPANHLPIRPPPLMADNLRSTNKILNAARKRWPDPITATFKLKGRFGILPRFPYQLAEFGFRASRFILRTNVSN